MTFLIITGIALAVGWLAREWGYGKGWVDGYEARDIDDSPSKVKGGTWLYLPDKWRHPVYDGSTRWPHGSEGEPL